MEYGHNPWTGVPPNSTLYANPIDPYQSVSQNPNPSYGQGQCLLFNYGHTNAASSEPTTVYYQDPNVVQLLGANDPYRLGEVAAVSLNGAEKLTPVNVNSNFLIQPVRSGSWGRGQRKSKTQPVWCDVCKLEFNSNIVLGKHKLGKRHTRSLEILKGGSVITAPTSAVSDTTVVGLQKRPNLENGQDAGGKAVELMKNLETKRQKVLQGGAASNEVCICLPCNVVCNSEAVFRIHLTGKKHIANIAMQGKLASVSASLIPSEASGNTFIGPQETPDIVNSGNGQDAVKKENLETKTQKVLEGGAATNEVRKCLLCEVVCNSETVLRLHLAGKKHIANMKKLASGAGVAPAN
ncbi:putative galacturonosyltransferase 13-like [Capsicum annuum]|nr:putative galacturonosyltransferase 13-like [Capsicum annuum]